MCDLRKCTEFLRVFLLSNGDDTNFQDYCESEKSYVVATQYMESTQVTQTAKVRKGEHQIKRNTEPGTQGRSPWQRGDWE